MDKRRFRRMPQPTGLGRLAAVTSALLVLSACSFGTSQNSQDASNFSQSSSLSQSPSSQALSTQTGEVDLYADWSEENPVYISFYGSSIQAEGSGVTVDGSTATITQPGTYVVSGSLDDGQLLIDAGKEDRIRIVLNGVQIHCSDSAAIYARQQGKLILSLEPGSQNILSDGTAYVYDSADSDEPSAALYSKDDLTINGTGSLTVSGNCNDAITCKDHLVIVEGSFDIQSADDGVIGRDSLTVLGGDFTLDVQGDGFKTTNDTDSSKGWMNLTGGSFTITAGADGFQAETDLTISGGDYTLITGGGSVNSSSGSESDGMGGIWGHWQQSSETEEAPSAKGIKAASALTISGGSFAIDSSDDALHTNGVMTISDGCFTISSGDDGAHADTSLAISGGTFHISKSYEGIESADIALSGGDISITASDDGINVAGGNDSSALGGRPGQNTFNSDGANLLTISGGCIVVDAGGDGLDANGSIEMTGGTVLVNGPTDNGNGFFDYDGTFTVSGGLLIAAGSSGMAQSISDGSSQYAVMMTYSSMQQAGTLVCLEDEEGNIIAAFAPSKTFQSVFISAPEITSGGALTFYTGGSISGTDEDGLCLEGSYTPGTQIASFTPTEAVTYLSESGVTSGHGIAGSFGGMGGQPGGMGGRGGPMG